MAQDTLLGFPAHTLPFRRGEFTALSTVSKRTALQSFFQFVFRYVSYNKRSFAPDGIKRDLVLAYRGAILYNDGVCGKSCGAVPRNNV